MLCIFDLEKRPTLKPPLNLEITEETDLEVKAKHCLELLKKRVSLTVLHHQVKSVINLLTAKNSYPSEKNE